MAARVPRWHQLRPLPHAAGSARAMGSYMAGQTRTAGHDHKPTKPSGGPALRPQGFGGKPVTVQSDLLVRVMALDRPESMNAVDLRTAKQILARLSSWERNYMVMAGVIRGNGTMFCSGTDVARVYHDPDAAAALRTELCRLAFTLHAYPKPIVALFDGPIIGGGYALAHGRHRIATEKASFFVYEPAFGLALEGGLSFVLPRLAGGNAPLGMFLGLTGLTLSGVDLVHAGLATAYMPAAHDEALVRRLGEVMTFNRDQEDNAAAVTEAVGMAVFGCSEVYAKDAEQSFPPQSVERFSLDLIGAGGHGRTEVAPLPGILAEVERCFDGVASVEEAEERLSAAAAGAGASADAGWARAALQRMRRSSPLALKVVFEQLRRSGGGLPFEDCLAQEFAANDALARTDEHAAAVAGLLQARDADVRWQRRLRDVREEDVADVLESAAPSAKLIL